jgi:glycosyltransferase involved in cell wall biosynthesis
LPKILRIINRFNLGGITYNVTYLSKYLPAEYETMLIGGDKEPGEDSSTFIPEQLGLKPILIPEMKRAISWSEDKKAYERIKKIIQDFKPDIVHTHASKAGAIGRLAAFNQKVPVIVHTFHGHVFHSYFGKAKTTLYKNVERYLAKRSSAIIAISDKQKYELTQIHKIAPPEKTHVINLGFDLNKFIDDKEDKRKDFRSKYLVEDDEIVLVIVGRLAPIKNHDMFLRCLKNALNRSTKKIRAFIVGDGETRAHCENTARNLNIDFTDFTTAPRKATLTFTSWITNVDWVLAGSDIVCLTSFNEGTPVSLIEAQAAGKPVITTDVGGVRDVVSDQTGFLTVVDDDAYYTEKLLSLIEEEALRQLMGAKGWEIVGKQFHYTRLVGDMDRLYKELLNKR